MIKIFKPTSIEDVSFETNGDIAIKPLKAAVHKEYNGEFYVSVECDTRYSPYIQDGYICVADTPQGEQYFRISNPIRTRLRVSFKAMHVFFDTKNMFVKEMQITQNTCNTALLTLKNKAMPKNIFEMWSDITTPNSYKCGSKSVCEVVDDILTLWGGSLVLDNFSIKILNRTVKDNGVTIQYGKNLLDMTCTEDWSEVVDAILPIGKNGILLNAIDPSRNVYLGRSETTSGSPRAKVVEFDQSDIDDKASLSDLVTDLTQQAHKYLREHSQPKISYSVKADINRTVDVGEVVVVQDAILGIDIEQAIVSYDYDCILKKYLQIDIGERPRRLSDLKSTINSKVTKKTTADVTKKKYVLSIRDYKDGETFKKSYEIYHGNTLIGTVEKNKDGVYTFVADSKTDKTQYSNFISEFKKFAPTTLSLARTFLKTYSD